MRLKKILLVSLLVVMTFLFCQVELPALGGGGCGCALTYMGAHLTSFLCIIVGGEMTYRECHYEY